MSSESEPVTETQVEEPTEEITATQPQEPLVEDGEISQVQEKQNDTNTHLIKTTILRDGTPTEVWVELALVYVRDAKEGDAEGAFTLDTTLRQVLATGDVVRLKTESDSRKRSKPEDS